MGGGLQIRRHGREGARLPGALSVPGVIAEKDILTCADGEVSFRYRNASTGKLERRTLPGAQFLWLVLQHVLPKGFQACAQLRLSAPQLQAPDRLAASATEVRSRPGDGMGQTTRTHPVRLLRGGDGDRANADSAGVRRAAAGPHCDSRCAVTM
ncbi:MAG: transposase [Betaproteobacteria bacterium]|nr:transposase [Betaproteobacteria bacterium]